MIIEAFFITTVTLVFCLLTMVVFGGWSWFDYIDEWLKQPHNGEERKK